MKSTTRISKDTVATAAAAVLLIVSASAAHAQGGSGPLVTNSQKSSQRLTNHPVGPSCTGEEVFVNGKSDTFTQSNQNRFRTRTHQNGRGQGFVEAGIDPVTGQPILEPTGSEYQYDEMTETEFSATQRFTVEFTTRKHLIRLASPDVPADDLFFHERFRCDGGGCQLISAGPDGCR